MSDSVLCPYCGEHETDLWDHDWGSHEELVTACGSCGKDYVLSRSVSVIYESHALNEQKDTP